MFIPRPETEALLEWAVAQPLPTRPVIVDLCTGSGALALALSQRWPDARVIAVDDSDDALAYARRNVAGTPVELLRADVTDPGCCPNWTAGSTSWSPTRPTSPTARHWNPKWPSMIRRMRCSAGRTGWLSSTPIVELAGRWLRAGGRCAVEHDDTTSAPTVEAFARAGRFADVTARRDLTGRPRFVTANARLRIERGRNERESTD